MRTAKDSGMGKEDAEWTAEGGGEWAEKDRQNRPIKNESE